MRRAMNPFRRSRYTRRPSESSLRARRRAHALRLSCPEQLEDRVVPTVVFQPVVNQTVVDGHGEKLPDPPVYMIFWGSGWTISTTPSFVDVTSAASRLLGGFYLSRLAQYTNPGQPSLGLAHLSRAFIDSTSPAPPASGF